MEYMVYCISDIHGDYARFQQMLHTIGFSDEDTLYIIGDVIDRAGLMRPKITLSPVQR